MWISPSPRQIYVITIRYKGRQQNLWRNTHIKDIPFRLTHIFCLTRNNQILPHFWGGRIRYMTLQNNGDNCYAWRRRQAIKLNNICNTKKSIDCTTLTADDHLNCCLSVLYKASNRSISSGEKLPTSEYNPTHFWMPS